MKSQYKNEKNYKNFHRKKVNLNNRFKINFLNGTDIEN